MAKKGKFDDRIKVCEDDLAAVETEFTINGIVGITGRLDANNRNLYIITGTGVGHSGNLIVNRKDGEALAAELTRIFAPATP